MRNVLEVIMRLVANRLFIGGALIALTASCMGLIGGSEEGGDSDQLCAGRVVARRLTRTQYNNTLRDLFDFDVGSPADDLPDDVAGANGLTVSDFFLQKHEKNVTELAALAVDNGFITCDPAIEERSCAREVFEPFMERAWRRPVTSEEVDGVLGYLDVVAQEPGETDRFPQAIRLGIQHVLMAPNFLYRFERLEAPTSPRAQELDAYDLASRLSYLIYDSMPDAALFHAAKAGTLADPKELAAQAERMLADPKGAALVDKLVGGWLWVDRVDVLNPKATLYPAFDAELKQSLKQEVALFVNEFLVEDRSFKDMLDADFTYVNDRLAEHYGIPGAFSKDFTRVSLADLPERGGLLTQGALLAATSVPNNDATAEVSETNIIVRGRFVLEQLLCFEFPPPPAGLDVGQIQAEAQEDIPNTAPRKVREGVRQAMQPCAGCHSYLDPIGFSMEHFDVTGAWRTVDTLDTAVDATGALKGADGSVVGEFDGARELGTLLKNDPRLSHCLTETVLRLAVERELDAGDDCRVQALSEQSDESGNGLRALVLSIIKSPTFTHQRGETP
jgi:hypothetical protein